MIGEKIGYVPVKPLMRSDGTYSEVLFDYADAARKLDQNQSYSQALIAIAAMKRVRPFQVDMSSMKWLHEGLDKENRALRSAGLEDIRIGDILPMI